MEIISYEEFVKRVEARYREYNYAEYKGCPGIECNVCPFEVISNGVPDCSSSNPYADASNMLTKTKLKELYE
jgi:hypothetical protein